MPAGLAFICLSAAVVDGDTLRCANIEQANGRVRLARIDAPEKREIGGAEATAALAELIADLEVRCEHIDANPRRKGFQEADPYGRIVARCYVDGVDLGEELLRKGHAARW